MKRNQINNAAELKALRDQANAAHQRAGCLYGIALARPTAENKAAVKDARHESQRLASEYKKADRAFYAEQAAHERDARCDRMAENDMRHGG